MKMRRKCAVQSGKIRSRAEAKATGIFFNRRKETFHWERGDQETMDTEDISGEQWRRFPMDS